MAVARIRIKGQRRIGQPNSIVEDYPLRAELNEVGLGLGSWFTSQRHFHSLQSVSFSMRSSRNHETDIMYTFLMDRGASCWGAARQFSLGKYRVFDIFHSE